MNDSAIELSQQLNIQKQKKFNHSGFVGFVIKNDEICAWNAYEIPDQRLHRRTKRRRMAEAIALKFKGINKCSECVSLWLEFKVEKQTKFAVTNKMLSNIELVS